MPYKCSRCSFSTILAFKPGKIEAKNPKKIYCEKYLAPYSSLLDQSMNVYCLEKNEREKNT